MATEWTENDFAAIYILSTEGECTWKDLRKKLGLESDHGMSLVVNRLKKQHALRSRREGRKTFYSVSPSWIKRNKELARILTSIGKGLTDNSAQKFAKDKEDVMRDIRRLLEKKFSDVSFSREAMLVTAFEEKLIARRLDMNKFGRRAALVLLAMCLMKRKADDQSAHLFANEYARQMRILTKMHIANIMAGIDSLKELEQDFDSLGHKFEHWFPLDEFIHGLGSFRIGVADEVFEKHPLDISVS